MTDQEILDTLRDVLHDYQTMTDILKSAQRSLDDAIGFIQTLQLDVDGLKYSIER